MDSNDFVQPQQSLRQDLENRSAPKKALSRYPGSLSGMDQFVADKHVSGSMQRLDDRELSRKVSHKDQYCPPCSLLYRLMIS